VPLLLALERPEKERGFSCTSPREKKLDTKRESIIIMFGSFLPGLWLVGTTKVYSGVGADIVMESITPAISATHT
jgi:hypothetical protein